MTSLPAQRFQLDARGLLRPGYAADVVIFDEKPVSNRATYEPPTLTRWIFRRSSQRRGRR